MNDSAKATIFVVDDTPENLQLLVGVLKGEGYNVHAAPNGRRALAGLERHLPDLILLDVRMPGMDGFEVCEILKKDARTRDIPVIFISALSDVMDKMQGFEAGGIDYITKPIQQEEVLARIKTHLLLYRLRHRLEEMVEERAAKLQQTNNELTREIAERERVEQKLQQAFEKIRQLKDRLQIENVYLREEIKLEHNFEEIIGRSEGLKYLLFKVEQVAATDATVLIIGETGTGKELIARAVHHAGLRNARPLVKVNCATLPATIIESELFGHEKGAFTGAAARQIGRFEFADGATIFLDEIGELPLELQAKLLRVIQEGEFERLGNPRTLKVDVRIIAATNRDLEQEVQAGRFRQDLYYRLNLYPLSVPPLRARPEDLPLLVQTFVRRKSTL